MKKIYQNVFKLISKNYYLIIKYCFYFFIIIIIILFSIINNAFFQTKIAKHILFKINKNYHTNILIDDLNINFLLGNMKIQNLKILDKKKNILIFIPKIEGNMNICNFFFKKFYIQNININHPKINIITYENDSISNIIDFIKCFKSKTKTSINNFVISNFHIQQASINIINNNKYFKLIFQGDYNFFSKKITFSNKLIESKISNIIIKGKYLNKKININFFTKNLFFTKNKLILFHSNLIVNKSKIINYFSLSYNTYTDLFNCSPNLFFDFIIKKGSYISSHDINLFINHNLFIKKSIFYITCQVRGRYNQNINILNLNLISGKNIIKSQHIILYEKKNNIHLYFQKNTFFKTSFFDIKQILPIFVINKIPVFFNIYGQVRYYGSMRINSQFIHMHGKLISSTIGIISGQILLFNFLKLKNIKYQGKLYININNIYPLLKNKNFKYINGELVIYGKGYQLKNNNIKLYGIIQNIFIYNKQIHNIKINGHFIYNYFYGLVHINDNHIKIKFNGQIQFGPHKYFLYGRINLIYLKFYFINEKFHNQSISGKEIDINLYWTTYNNLKLNLYLNNIFYNSSPKKVFIPKINFIYNFLKQQNQFCILSIPEFINLSFFGKFQCMQLYHLLINNINKLLNNQEYYSVSSNQYLYFKINITDNFINIFDDINHHLYSCVIIGNLSDKHLKVDVKSNFMKNDDYYIKNIILSFNTNQKYNVIINIDTLFYKTITIKHINLYTFIKNKLFFIKIYFYLKIYNLYQEVNLNFFKRNSYLNGIKYMFIGLSRSLIKMNNNNWWLNKNNDTNYSILKINLQNQHFIINELYNDIIHHIINLSSKVLNNHDHLTQVLLKQIKNIYKIFFLIKKYNSLFIFEFLIKIHHIYINNIYIGDIKVHIIYNNNKIYKILLNIKNKNQYILYISGYIKNFFNKQKYINLKIKIFQLPVCVFKEFIKNTFSDFRGRCTGILDVIGDDNNIKYYGYLYLNNIGLKINNLNTDYEIIGRPLILFKNHTIFFNNFIIRDTKYNSIGYLNGIMLNEDNQWIISVYINSNNLLVLDNKEKNNKIIYGKIFAKSKIHILGYQDNLYIHVTNAKISNNSKLFIITDNNEFNIRNIQFLKLKNHDSVKKESFYKKVFFNIESNINEKCNIQLFFNSKKNSFIQARGTGNILFKTNSLGIIDMSGRYFIKNGYYQFKTENIPLLNKKFKIRRGGTITWLGLPTNPKVNIQTYYIKLVNNIEEYIKIPHRLKNINSELIINISGNLFQPKFQFNIDFYGIKKNIKKQIIQKLYTRDEIITQFGSILLLGKLFINHSFPLLSTQNIIKFIVNIFLTNNRIYYYNDQNNHQQIIKSITYSLIYDINKYFSIKGMMLFPINILYNHNQAYLNKEVEVQINLNKKLDNNCKIILLYHYFHAYRKNRDKVHKILFNKIYGGSIFYTISFDKIKHLWQIFFLYK